ncbi:MAG: hypothetical protein H7287_02380 [Thermoleophilia bacterium]|nr:hypothetical protein [Thermoleophilia bacterium]
MPFYNSVRRAIGAANAALGQLRSYRYNYDASTQPNRDIRNQARQTITYAHDDLQRAVYNASWEGVRGSARRDASRGVELLGQATWALSDRPASGQRADVYRGVDQIRTALSYLYRAQY